MIVRSITIAREGDYGYGTCDTSKPLKAKLKLLGKNGEIELYLDEAASAKIIALVADEITAETKKVAEALTIEVLTQAEAVPQIEGPALEDEMPF
jgi:hypothetical protein